MGETITLKTKANAKINLTLDILGQRPDGYHLLSSVMQEISLFDELSLTLSASEKNKISIEGNFDCPPEKNLCYKAAEAFFLEFGISGAALHISVEKRIPSGAGLGGGSSDGAAVIRALAGYYGIDDKERLKKLCLSLGADVPFFLEGGTQRMEGIGERLSPVSRCFDAFVVLAKPFPSALSGDMYRLYDSLGYRSFAATENFLAENHQGGSPFDYVSNALEKAAVSFCGDILSIKTAFLDSGAKAACMSGSGTAVYGLFQEREAVRAALEKVKENSAFCGIYEFI